MAPGQGPGRIAPTTNAAAAKAALPMGPGRMEPDSGEERSAFLPVIAASGLFAAGAAAFAGWGHAQEAFAGAVRVDDFTRAAGSRRKRDG